MQAYLLELVGKLWHIGYYKLTIKLGFGFKQGKTIVVYN
jgi:hypothetical protein